MDRELNARTARHLREGANRVPTLTAIVGLDAFVDEIVRVVDKRASASEFNAIEQLNELGIRISSAAGRSTNLELVVERVKLGGNGPIMANALASLGPTVTCIGPMGEGELHPAFSEISSRARVISVGEPAHTDALEFEDGKLMLGKLQPLNEVTWGRLQQRIGALPLRQMLINSNLVSLVNWTMIPAMSHIWEQILSILAKDLGASKIYFFDLADPEKHEDGKIVAACKLIARFQQCRRTILGLNEKEAFLVGNALGYTGGHSTRLDIDHVATYLSQVLPVEAIIVHPRAYAVVASRGELTADVDGPFTDSPVISTGAGDHFNAGFCLSKLLGLSDSEAATAAVGTSGYYVRNASSPSLDQLIEFLVGIE